MGCSFQKDCESRSRSVSLATDVLTNAKMTLMDVAMAGGMGHFESTFAATHFESRQFTMALQSFRIDLYLSDTRWVSTSRAGVRRAPSRPRLLNSHMNRNSQGLWCRLGRGDCYPPHEILFPTVALISVFFLQAQTKRMASLIAARRTPIAPTPSERPGSRK